MNKNTSEVGFASGKLVRGEVSNQACQTMPSKVWERALVERFGDRLGQLHNLAARTENLANRLKGSACEPENKQPSPPCPNGFNDEMNAGLHFMDSLMESLDAALNRLEA